MCKTHDDCKARKSTQFAHTSFTEVKNLPWIRDLASTLLLEVSVYCSPQKDSVVAASSSTYDFLSDLMIS